MTFFSCSILERNTQKVNNFKKMGRKSTVKKRYVDKGIKAGYTLKLLVYFQKHGIKNFSMSKMASDFNMSKTTLYNHFDSKESMIEAAINYKLTSIGDYKTVLFDKDLPYTERLRKSLLFYCVQIFDMSRNLLSEVKEDYPSLWIKVIKFQKQLLRDLHDYYKLGQRIGHYKVDFDIELIVANDQSFFQWLSQKHLPKKYEGDIAAVVNEYCRLKFKGIMS